MQFGQIDGALNRAHEGTGLGLPLCKALVEQHGGTLEMQSELGVGTTVTVRFPAARTAPPVRYIARRLKRRFGAHGEAPLMVEGPEGRRCAILFGRAFDGEIVDVVKR